MIKDVADGIELVSGAIKNMKEIYTAVKDGRQYFTNKYPDIKNDVSNMCVELRKTCNAVATASSIMTHFRFNVSPNAIDHEPTRFNEYFIKYKTSSVEVENLIRSLKGSCTKIIHHAEKLKREASSRINTNDILALFGLYSHERTRAVEEALQNVYNEEKEWYIVVGKMSTNITKAVNDVSNTLGANGMMHSDNVKAAALLLNDYAELFGALEIEARNQANEIQDLIDELNT